MRKNKLMVAAILSTACITAFAGEYTTTVSYPSFHCTIANQSTLDSVKQVFKDAQVKFDTQNILLRGAATGQPYVTTPGHINYQPLSILGQYYFETAPDDSLPGGQVIITVSGVDEKTFRLNCEQGHGDGLALYAADSDPSTWFDF